MSTSPGISASHTYQLFADYHQVYLEDCQGLVGVEADPAEQVAAMDALVAQLLSKEAEARHLGVALGVVCILTARAAIVPVTVEVRSQPPFDDWSGWDRVVEASLELPSGCLVLHSVSDYLPDAPRMLVEPGTYRMQVSFGGLDTLSSDELEGDDHYRVVLWPAPAREPATLFAKGGNAASSK